MQPRPRITKPVESTTSQNEFPLSCARQGRGGSSAPSGRIGSVMFSGGSELCILALLQEAVPLCLRRHRPAELCTLLVALFVVCPPPVEACGLVGPGLPQALLHRTGNIIADGS